MHIANIVELGEIVETRRDGRHDAKACRERRHEGVVCGYAVQSMQPYHYRTRSSPRHLLRASACESNGFYIQSGLRSGWLQCRWCLNRDRGVPGPPLVLPLVEAGPEFRYHIAREALGILEDLFFRHVAEMA